jgi:hypothetical protein
MNLCTSSNWTAAEFSTFIILVSLHLIQAEILWKSYIFINILLFANFSFIWTRMCVLLQSIGHSNTDTILCRNKQKSISKSNKANTRVRQITNRASGSLVPVKTTHSVSETGCDSVFMGKGKHAVVGPFETVLIMILSKCVTAFFPWRRRRIYSPKRNGFSSLRQRTAFQVSLGVC